MGVQQEPTLRDGRPVPARDDITEAERVFRGRVDQARAFQSQKVAAAERELAGAQARLDFWKGRRPLDLIEDLREETSREAETKAGEERRRRSAEQEAASESNSKISHFIMGAILGIIAAVEWFRG
jgi:hypothetical protein